MDNWFNSASEWLVYALTVVVIIAAAEGGAMLARWERVRRPDDADRFLSTLAAPSLGLLALMIGFSFAMALSRFEARKAAVLDEANAIGTAALRGRMLTEPFSTTVAPLFKEYAQLRVSRRGALLDSPESVRAIQRSLEVQEALWRQAMGAVTANPHMVPTGLFVQALNDMIDMHEKRLTAGRNHVPPIVLITLEGIAVFAMACAGYGVAMARMRRRGALLIMGVVIGSVIALIVDLDRPQAGFIVVSQQPVLDLLEGMR
jgi:hypothetical protein